MVVLKTRLEWNCMGLKDVLVPLLTLAILVRQVLITFSLQSILTGRFGVPARDPYRPLVILSKHVWGFIFPEMRRWLHTQRCHYTCWL